MAASTSLPSSRPSATGRANADTLVKQAPAYPKAVLHLALNAFLQRVINGRGRVIREFATGRGAMDLFVEYGTDRFAVELKRVRNRDALETVVSAGVVQLTAYLDTLGLERAGSFFSTSAPAVPGTSASRSARSRTSAAASSS